MSTRGEGFVKMCMICTSRPVADNSGVRPSSFSVSDAVSSTNFVLRDAAVNGNSNITATTTTSPATNYYTSYRTTTTAVSESTSSRVQSQSAAAVSSPRQNQHYSVSTAAAGGGGGSSCTAVVNRRQSAGTVDMITSHQVVLLRCVYVLFLCEIFA